MTDHTTIVETYTDDECGNCGSNTARHKAGRINAQYRCDDCGAFWA